MFKENSTILFQGDSITDTQRDRKVFDDLGLGYPLFVRKILDEKYPDLNVKLINRGIGGNTTLDLINRWQNDCINLKPDYMSILIGINDVWRDYSENDPTSAMEYKERYKKIIDDTLNNTEAKILLIKPYLLNVNDLFEMSETLKGKQAIVDELASEYHLPILDLQFAFDIASKFKEPSYFSADCVHPTQSGHEFIANLWLDSWRKNFLNLRLTEV